MFAKYIWNNQIKGDGIGMACSTRREKINVYRVLVWQPEGKRPLGRYRRRREYKIKIDLRERGWRGVDWIQLAQGLICTESGNL
jgi:hypothetical protein